MSLAELPQELVSAITSHLDLRSSLRLASSSTALCTLVASPSEWQHLLKRHWDFSEENPSWSNNEDVLDMAVRFIKERFTDTKEHFLQLAYAICQAFPFTNLVHIGLGRVVMRCPRHLEHPLSPTGFLLIDRLLTFCDNGDMYNRSMWEMVRVEELYIEQFSGHHTVDNLLPSLAFWGGIQEEAGRGMVNIEARFLRWFDGEQGEAIISLMDSCDWEVEELDIRDIWSIEKDEWAELARVVEHHGTLGEVRTCKEVLVKGRREDVKKVWENCKSMFVNPPFPAFPGKEEEEVESWEHLVEIMDEEEEEEEYFV